MKSLKITLAIYLTAMVVQVSTLCADDGGIIYVILESGTNGSYIDTLCSRYSAQEEGYDALGDVWILSVTQDASDKTIDMYLDSNVSNAWQPTLVLLQATPNDSLYTNNLQWNLDTLHCPVAWDSTKGEDAVIAILEDGIKLDHEDLVGDLWHNYNDSIGDMNGDGYPGIKNVDDDEDGFTDEDRDNKEPGDVDWDSAGCYVDDDENGFYDDYMGWDFYDRDSLGVHVEDNVPGCYECESQDAAHGTKVTGFAAAVTNNDSIGMASVAWESEHMQVKDAEGGGGDAMATRDATYYAVYMGADVVNANGVGPSYIVDPFLEDAVTYAYEHGVSYICPVGNRFGTWLAPAYPSWDLRAIGVAGTEVGDSIGDYSLDGQRIDVSAPYHGKTTTHDGGYGSAFGGTCFATPHVSGVAALLVDYYQNDSTFTVDSLYKALVIGAAAWKDGNYSDDFGFGRISADMAINYRVFRESCG